ncbi:hypothetical protein [Ancylobacter radicis]|uniref:Uncharacterized protein n=1 Tax=Ancylobacter radicis TaxID=2836179 RepID=A0ABS5RAF3_9HYPH|nr:hypothetical protein [Ancylobacter radicis]MBS9477809.1 hypothetical protein [Ancylobacter radicis]
MQSKWRAPACYVGVAVICALYLSVVPGVSITDVCAGAGLGAAVMWAINEWETGKWNVAVPGQAVAATAIAMPSSAMPSPISAGGAVTAALAATAAPSDATAAPSEAIAAESRPRIDSGVATPESLAKWEIDDKEPSWDPSALAETWAKLRRELSISGPRRPQVAPDLPRTAQLAKGPVNGPVTPASKSSVPARSTAPAAPAKAVPAQPAPAKPALGSLSKAYQESQRASGTGSKPGSVSTTASLAGSKSSYTPGSSFAAPASSTATPARKVAGGSAEPARPNSFLRPGPMRPR